MKRLSVIFYFTLQFITNTADAQVMGWSCLKDVAGDTMKFDGEVSKMLKAKDGSFYISGNFQFNNSYRYVAKWNDTSLTPLESATDPLYASSMITDFCEDAAGNIYAACAYDGNGKWFVAKWDGSTWSALGDPDELGANGIIYSICADANGNIYAASLKPAPNAYPFVSKYDGNSWTELPTSTVINGNIYSLCADKSGNVYAGGACYDANNNVYAIKWDGSNWTVLGTGGNILNNAIRKIYCDDQDNVYVGGSFRNANNNTYVAKWSGTGWEELGTGVNALQATDDIHEIYSDGNNIYAGGRFRNAAGSFYVATWDGTNWKELNSNSYQLPASGNYISTICKDKNGVLYAGGNFTDYSSGTKYAAKYTDLTSLKIDAIKTDGNIKIYPNPTISKIILEIKGHIKYNTYTLFDTRGCIVKIGSIYGTETSIDISALVQGNYFMRVGVSSYSIKIEKQ